MGWQWSISSEAQAARCPPQALASSRISLESTSSFFCASPCTLPVPASPSTPPSAPLPTAIEMLVQARATTAISWRRSALMRPARCSSIRWRVRETWLDIADLRSGGRGAIVAQGAAGCRALRKRLRDAVVSAAVELPLEAEEPGAVGAGFVEAAVAFVHDHRADVVAVEQVVDAREQAKRTAGGIPAARGLDVQQAVARCGGGAGIVDGDVAEGFTLERGAPGAAVPLQAGEDLALGDAGDPAVGVAGAADAGIRGGGRAAAAAELRVQLRRRQPQVPGLAQRLQPGQLHALAARAAGIAVAAAAGDVAGDRDLVIGIGAEQRGLEL